MTQHQLDRAVARATGESPRTIRRLGFTLLPSEPGADLNAEDLALAVACPFCRQPTRLDASAGGLPAMAECDRCDVFFAYDEAEIVVTTAAALAPAAPAAA